MKRASPAARFAITRSMFIRPCTPGPRGRPARQGGWMPSSSHDRKDVPLPKDTQTTHDPRETLEKELGRFRRWAGLPSDAFAKFGIVDAEHHFGLEASAEIKTERTVYAVDHGVARYRDRSIAEAKAAEDMAAFINTDWSKNVIARPDQAVKTKTPVLHRSSAAFAHHCEPCNGHGQKTCGKCGGDGDVRCPQCNTLGWTICSCGNGYHTCTGCGGSGSNTVSRTVQRGNWQEAVWETVRCGTCFGSGKGHQCYACSGTGRAPCFTCRGNKTINCNNCGASGNVGCQRCARTGTATSEITLAAHADISMQPRTDPEDLIQRNLFPTTIPYLTGQPGFEYTRHADPQSGARQSARFECLGRTSRMHEDAEVLLLSWGSHRKMTMSDKFKPMLWKELSPLALSGDYRGMARIPAGRDILTCGIGSGSEKEEAQTRITQFLPEVALSTASAAGERIDQSLKVGDGARKLRLALFMFLAGLCTWAVASVDLGLKWVQSYLETETGKSLPDIGISNELWMYLMLGLAVTMLISHLRRKARRRRRRLNAIVGEILDGKPRLSLGKRTAVVLSALAFGAGISVGPTIMPVLQGVPEYSCPILEMPGHCLSQSWSIYGRILGDGINL